MVAHHEDTTRVREERWLKHYYFIRTAFSAIWVALAFSIGQHSPVGAAVLLVVYPAWDALANYVDMSRSGGMAENRTQATNVLISVLTAVAVIVAWTVNMNGVLGVFGVWAILAGLLQLGTAVRRWKRFGAQWAMILSGGQSALAGTFSSCRPMRQCLPLLPKWLAMPRWAPSIFSCLRSCYPLASCDARLPERLEISVKIPAVALASTIKLVDRTRRSSYDLLHL